MNNDNFIHETAQVSENTIIGKNTKIWNWCQVRENSKIGDNCILAKGVYVDFGVIIGNNVKIQNNVSIYHGLTIHDGVFIGPHVCFTNDKIPRAINSDESLKEDDNWTISKTIIEKGASLGANSTILPGIKIGKFAMIAAGSVVTKDVPDFGLVVGIPAKLLGYVCKCGKRLEEIKKLEDYIEMQCLDQNCKSKEIYKIKVKK